MNTRYLFGITIDPKTMSVAHIYGIYAYCDGLKRSANPYLKSDEQHEEWDDGWGRAYLEDDD